MKLSILIFRLWSCDWGSGASPEPLSPHCTEQPPQLAWLIATLGGVVTGLQVVILCGVKTGTSVTLLLCLSSLVILRWVHVHLFIYVWRWFLISGLMVSRFIDWSIWYVHYYVWRTLVKFWSCILTLVCLYLFFCGFHLKRSWEMVCSFEL